MADTQKQLSNLWKLYRDAPDDEYAAEVKAKIDQVQAQAVDNPFLVGVGSGLTRVGQDVAGIRPFAREQMGLAEPGTFDKYRADVNAERALMDPLKAEGMSASAGEVVGEIAGALPFGGVTGVTAKQAPNFAGRLASNLGIGATQGMLGADDTLEGALWGAGGAGIGEVVGDIAGLLRGGKGADVPPSMTDVPQMRSDDTGSIYGIMEQGAQFTPSGRNAVVKAREQQQEALQEGVGRLQEQYAGPDVSQIPESLENVKKSRKAEASAKYDLVEKEMSGVTTGDDWRGSINETIQRLEADPPALRDNALIDRLRAYTDFNDPNYLAPGGRPSTWDELRRLRGNVGRDISDTFKGGSQVGTTDTPRLYEAKGAITSALDDAAEVATGALWRDADTFYRTDVAAPYKDSPSIVKDIMNVQSPGQAVDKILTKNVANNPRLVGHVMDALDEPGKASLRSEMLNRAFDPKADGQLSPAQAANFIHSKREVFEKMFPGENIDELVKFLRHIKGAGQGGDIPATGMGAAMAQGVASPTGVGALLGGGGLAGGLDLMTTGGMMTAGMTIPVIWGKLLAAGATGKPGAMGDVIAEIGTMAEPAGRLAGTAMETEE